MSLVKIGIANIDTAVGNFSHNLAHVTAKAFSSISENCTLVVFQEQTLTGYPCEDLIQWELFVEEQLKALHKFVQLTLGLPQIFVIGTTVPVGGNLFNCAVVVHKGVILGIVPKEELPTYGVFHEWRTFTPGKAGWNFDLKLFGATVPFGDLIFNFPFGKLAVEVCEDVWSKDGPMSRRSFDADIVVNISASPWRRGVVATRREMLATRSSDNNVVLVYANQVGGQDALVFDGGCFVFQGGRLVCEAPRWQEGMTTCVVDLSVTRRMRRENTTWRTDWSIHRTDSLKSRAVECDFDSAEFVENISQRQGNPFLPAVKTPVDELSEYFEDVLMAMKTGLKGYFEKTGKFERIGIALSGGNDSYLTLVVAWLYAQEKFSEGGMIDQAALKDFIHCISMPSRFNSEGTRSIAQTICEELGVTFREVSISEAYEREVEAAKETTGRVELTALTLQNIQARIRGMRMWNWSNTARGLWIHTGNLTENAVGYTTIGGDMMGGFSLIGDLPKSVVLRLLAYLATKYPWESLKRLLATKASAELAENQQDERELMPFEVLDTLLDLLVGEKYGPVKMYLSVRAKYSDAELTALAPWYKSGDLKSWVKRFVGLFFANEYKRVQMPQAVHLGSIDLDRERALHLPVVSSDDWLQKELDAINDLP